MTTQFKILIGILFTFATLVVLILLGVNEQNRMDAQAATFQGRNVEQGAAYFEQYCYTCHGVHGEGIPAKGPPLNRKDLLDTKNTPYLKAIKFGGTLDDFLHDTIAAGRPQPSEFYASQHFLQPMPTWSQDYGGPLRPDQVDSLVAFVENWAPGQYEPLVALNQTPSAGGTPGATPTQVAGCSSTVPAPYGCAKPPFPLPPSADIIAAGQSIFSQKCSPCHGATGQGDGPGAAGLPKKPRNFTDCTAMAQFPMDLHYQRVNEGVLTSGMPAWKGNLTDEQIWQVIMYERSFCQLFTPTQ